jgi:hypothetical protein
MASTYTDSVNQFTDRILDGMRKVDELAVNATSTVTERIGGILPDELPGASTLRNLPQPEEFVKLYFDFVERLVKTQRTYSLDIAKALQPITGKIWKQTSSVRKAA